MARPVEKAHYDWYKYVIEKEKGVHTYGYIIEASQSGGPPHPPPHRDEHRQNGTSGSKIVSDGFEPGEQKILLFTISTDGFVIVELTYKSNCSSNSTEQVADAQATCTGAAQNYFATIMDEHGKYVKKLLYAELCPPDKSCESPVSLKTMTAEWLRNPGTQLSVCARDPTPTDDTGPIRTESRVFIGVNKDTCELKTFDEPPTPTESASGFLLAVTVNRCITSCNPTTAIYWACSDNRNCYYMVPEREGEKYVVCVKVDSKEKVETYRHWSNDPHNTGL